MAHVSGPFVLEDGTVTLVSRVTQSSDSYSHWDGYQTWWPAPGGSCTAEVRRFTLAPGASAPTSAVVSTAAYPSTCSVPFYLEDYRLLPDGQGGLLLGHRRTDVVMRLAPNLTLSLGRTLRLDPPQTGTTVYATEHLLGDDAAYAFVSGVTARSGLPAEYWTKAVGFRPDTLDWFSEVNVSGLDTAPRHLRLEAATEGSGVLVTGPQWDSLSPVAEGLWAGWGAAPALRAGQEVSKAYSDLKDADASARNASPERYGLFVKGHTAVRAWGLEFGLYRHATVRAVLKWDEYSQLSEDLRGRFQPMRAVQPVGHDMMMTIGARPAGGTGDTSLSPDGKTLEAVFNHTSDRSVLADDVRRLTYAPAQLVPVIQALANANQYFMANQIDPTHQLPYEAFPDPVGGINCPVPYVLLNCSVDIWDGYNSNSFVSGLLGAVSLPLPQIPDRYPGWWRSVAPTKFGVGQ